jgi:hypothetical protein
VLDDIFGEGGYERPEVWDGEPHLYMEREQWSEIMAFIPHFNGVITGPIPLGSTNPIILVVERILKTSLSAAEDVLYEMAATVCANASYPFIREEWTVQQLGCRGCS